MKKLAGACIALFAFAACGDDGGGGTPDANPNSPDAMVAIDAPPSPDAPATPDAAPNPDADLADAAPNADAMCAADAECVGRNDADTVCIGNAIVTCNLDAMGCLKATSVPCATVGDVCVDNGTPMCAANGAGDSCAAPMYITAPISVSGTDITADYTNAHTFGDATCSEDEAGSSVEAVFAVNLAAYQGIQISESGTMDAIVGIQRTCGDANVCLASSDDPEPSTTAFVTDVPTTVYIWGGAYDTAPNPAAYSFDFTFTTCGDGVIEGAEVCDDNNHDAGDGCSSSCQIEFGYTCNNSTPPSVCTAFPDLGTHGNNGTITRTSTTTLQPGESEFYTVTFTEAVEVSGTVSPTAGGDPDIFGYSPTRFVDGIALDGADDTSMTGPLFFPAGQYVIEIYAYDQAAALAGYSINLTVATAPTPTDLGTFAPAAAIPNVVQAASTAAGASNYYTITFSAPVLFSGTINGFTTGDPDLFMHGPGALAGTLQQKVGAEAWTDVPLPANTYYFRVKAFAVDGALDAFTATLSTTAAP